MGENGENVLEWMGAGGAGVAFMALGFRAGAGKLPSTGQIQPARLGLSHELTGAFMSLSGWRKTAFLVV